MPIRPPAPTGRSWPSTPALPTCCAGTARTAPTPAATTCAHPPCAQRSTAPNGASPPRDESRTAAGRMHGNPWRTLPAPRPGDPAHAAAVYRVNDRPWLVERRLTPARQVDVEAMGRWWPAVQHGWRMYADGTGWRAPVRFVAAGDDGPASIDADLPAERVRVRVKGTRDIDSAVGSGDRHRHADCLQEVGSSRP